MKSLLVIYISFTAILSGFLMISNPDGGILKLSLSLLEGTPFKNFMIPGILLAIIVGGIILLAVLHNIKHQPNRFNWALAGGITISGVIHSVHWLHILYPGIGILIILFDYQLKGKWAV